MRPETIQPVLRVAEQLAALYDMQVSALRAELYGCENLANLYKKTTKARCKEAAQSGYGIVDEDLKYFRIGEEAGEVTKELYKRAFTDVYHGVER